MINRILREYDSKTLTTQEKFYRIRKDPIRPSHVNEYDSPPAELSEGRLNTTELRILYGSPICRRACTSVA